MKTRVFEASFLAFGAVGVLGASSLLAPTDAHAQASSTVGSLRGTVKDKTGGNALGATIVATSPALVGEQAIITDEAGQYFITALPPGLYTLTIFYENMQFTRQGVLIQVGKESVVNITVDPTAGTKTNTTGEVIELNDHWVPTIDQGSTKIGVTLNDDYTRNVPTGRTFGGVLGSAAGTQTDLFGTSISGATSAENTYIVEGINTTDTGFGGLSSNLPNEFVQETEVITGGYNAEFGRATGGIVNVVTKQGSNEFHGSVFGYVTPGQFVSAAKTIQRDGSSIDSATNLDYNYDLGAEVGGPIIKDKLWFHVGFNPSFIKQTVTRKVQTQVDENQDGIPDVDPDTGFAIHAPVSQSDIPTNFATYFFTAKINGAINQNNQFQISAFGNPTLATPLFAIGGNPGTTTFKNDQGAYDLSAKYTSKFNEGKTQLDAVVGFHRGYNNALPLNSDQNVPFMFERANHFRSLYDFAAANDGRPGEGEANIGACNDTDPNDPYPKIQNCPTLGYAWQGLGFLEKRTNDRTSAVLSVTQRVKALGYHTFKVGVDAEFATYNSNRSYTGGEVFRHNTLDPMHTGSTWQLREFQRFNRNLTSDEINALAMDPNAVALETGQILCANGRAICETASALNADTNNTGLAAYIQDSWQIFPNFTINAGLRWEQMTGYVAKALQGTITPTNEVIPDEAYKLNNLIAPRLGFIYDPTKEGKSKVFGHWGRFYENVPMDLNVRSFGGEIQNFTQLNAHKLQPGQTAADGTMFDPKCIGDYGTPNLAQNLAGCTDRVQQSLIGEGVEFVSPGLKGQYTQEIILGTEYEVYSGLKFGASYIHRTLPQVIEDVSTDGGNNYLITNPGNDFTGAANDLHKQSQDLLMAGGCTGFDDDATSCNKDKRDLAALLQSRSDQLAYVKHFDAPVRNYDALQLSATQRPTKQSLLVASYTYSVSKGNYPGLFSTETGQLDPNITSLYDLPDLMANRYGPLGLDRPHNFKVDGFYRFDMKKAGLLTTGASFRAQSGLAHNVLGASPHPGYGTGESYILGRGDNGRSPVTSQMDVHLSYGRQLNKTTTLEAFVNVFNLFNQQDELSVDENYTFDFTNPIVGGDLKDAAHAKVLTDPAVGGGGDTNTTVTPNKNFNHSASLQAPRNVQVGLRLTF